MWNADQHLHYRVRVAPRLARSLMWLLWPLYLLLRALRFRFVLNISDSTGHTLSELDYFFRRLRAEELDPKARYLLVKPANPFSKVCVRLYGDSFLYARADDFVYNAVLPFTLRYPKLTVDCGLSQLKWQLPEPGRRYLATEPLPGQSYLVQITKMEAVAQWDDYFRLGKAQQGYHPMRGFQPRGGREELLRFLGGREEKMAVFHIKLGGFNATAAPTDPETYVPAMECLRDAGYSLVFAGREAMPDAFKRLDVLNYANSEVASFANDIFLFDLCEVAMAGASGAAYFPDVLDKHYLFLNSWVLSLIMPSEKCVVLPTLIERADGGRMQFVDQMRVYKEIPDVPVHVFPENQFRPRNCSGEEVGMAMRELLALKSKYVEPSELQLRLRALEPEWPTKHTRSRVSQFFLEQHLDCF